MGSHRTEQVTHLGSIRWFSGRAEADNQAEPEEEPLPKPSPGPRCGCRLMGSRRPLPLEMGSTDADLRGCRSLTRQLPPPSPGKRGPSSLQAWASDSSAAPTQGRVRTASLIHVPCRSSSRRFFWMRPRTSGGHWKLSASA
jgi:hypothetical protein